MELFPWKDEYSVHIALIDEQHKKLLAVVNELHHGVKEGHSREDMQRVFAGLLEYALHHFKTEEDLMTRYSFPGFEEHKQEHDEFRKRLVQFLDAFLDANRDVAMDMVQFLVSWIKVHVFFTDMKYSAFLNERGVL